MFVTLIVAMAHDRIIGRDNQLPWRLPADLKRFKRLTMGHHLLVGRRTWESIGRPLPGRKMLVLSRSEIELPEEVRLCASLEQALELAREAGEDELFVAGGEQIYELTMPLADRLHVTEIDLAIDGDARFPAIDPALWHEVERRHNDPDGRNPRRYDFVHYERRDEPLESPAEEE